MKIVIKKDDNDTKCLAQLRDIKYLAQRYNSDFFEDFYEAEKLKGLADEDFIELINKKVKDIVLNSPFIVDFTEYAKCDLRTLSRLIVLSINSLNGPNHDDDEHRRADLLDICDFKKGILPYRIPVAFDNRVSMDLGPVHFGTSTIPGYYMLKKKDINIDLMNFLFNNYYLLHSFVDDKGVCVGFESVKVGDELIFKFTTKTKLQAKVDEIKKKFS